MKKILSLALLGAISANAMNMAAQPPQLFKNPSNTSTTSNSSNISNESNVSRSIRNIQEDINNKEYGTQLQELSENFLDSEIHKLDMQEIMSRFEKAINNPKNKGKKIKIESFIAQVYPDYKKKKKQKELKKIAHVFESFMEIAKELEKSKQEQKDLTGTLRSNLNKMYGKKKAGKIMGLLRDMKDVAKLFKNHETTGYLQDLIAEQEEAQKELDVLSFGLASLLAQDPNFKSKSLKELGEMKEKQSVVLKNFLEREWFFNEIKKANERKIFNLNYQVSLKEAELKSKEQELKNLKDQNKNQANNQGLISVLTREIGYIETELKENHQKISKIEYHEFNLKLYDLPSRIKEEKAKVDCLEKILNSAAAAA